MKFKLRCEEELALRRHRGQMLQSKKAADKKERLGGFKKLNTDQRATG